MPPLSPGQMCAVFFFREDMSLKGAGGGGAGGVLPALLLPSCVPPGSSPGVTPSPNLVPPSECLTVCVFPLILTPASSYVASAYLPKRMVSY